jgi:hypothetical protein
MEGVRKHARANALAQPEIYTTSRTNARLAAANNWFKLDVTKRWTTASPGFNLLVKAIVDPDAIGPSHTLPGVSRPILPPTTLGILIRKRGAPRLTPLGNAASAAASAPMFAGSSFSSIASTLVTIVAQQLDIVNPSEQDLDRWFGETCSAVCSQLRINFIPWSPDAQNANAPRRSAVWNQYIIIGQAPPPAATSQSALASLPPSTPAGSSSNPALSLSTATFGQPWSPGSLSLLLLPSHLLIMRVPDDIATGFDALSTNATLPDSIITRAYDWARASYTHKNKIHHLSLITAWFMARLAPGYQLQKPAPDAPTGTMPVFTSDRVNRRYPVSDGPTAFGLWLIYLMNMLCDDSPVRMRMIHKKSKNVGPDWVDPMSMLVFSMLPSFCSDSVLFSSQSNPSGYTWETSPREDAHSKDICRSLLARLSLVCTTQAGGAIRSNSQID